jgi:hypothetical protein
MYGFPLALSPRMFVGKRLTSMLFAEYLVGLQFDGEVHLDVYSELGHELAGEFADFCDLDSPVLTTRLPRLVGQLVVSAELEGRGTLKLGFETGEVLLVHEDTDMYECYHIEIPGHPRYVV